MLKSLMAASGDLIVKMVKLKVNRKKINPPPVISLHHNPPWDVQQLPNPIRGSLEAGDNLYGIPKNKWIMKS